jgi:AbrB family looped-hinge helix DNA binding protein
MALVRVKRSAQITLPAELRKQFHLKEGDYLEAEVVKDDILLKPVSIMDRYQAGKHLLVLLERVHAKQLQSDTNPQDEEEEIVRLIKEMRRKYA